MSTKKERLQHDSYKCYVCVSEHITIHSIVCNNFTLCCVSGQINKKTAHFPWITKEGSVICNLKQGAEETPRGTEPQRHQDNNNLHMNSTIKYVWTDSACTEAKNRHFIVHWFFHCCLTFKEPSLTFCPKV